MFIEQNTKGNGIKEKYTIFKQIMTIFGTNRGKGLGMTKTKTRRDSVFFFDTNEFYIDSFLNCFLMSNLFALRIPS